MNRINYRLQNWIFNRITLLTIILCLTLCVTFSSYAQKAPPPIAEPELTQSRVSDAAYGISFLKPDNTAVIKPSRGKYMLVVKDLNKQYELTLKVEQTKTGSKISVAEVMNSALKHFAAEQYTSRIIEKRIGKVGKTDYGVVYLDVPQAFGKTKAFIAEAYIRLLDIKLADGRILSDRFAFIRLKSSIHNAKPMRAMFDKLINTLQFDNPYELAQERKKMIERGRDWRKELNAEKIHKSLIPRQYFVIKENDKPIGFIYIEQIKTSKNGNSGIEVIIRSRVPVPGGQYDSEAHFFASDNRLHELWKTTATLRPDIERRDLNGQKALPQTTIESGMVVGNGKRIDVSYSGLEGTDTRKFPVPLGHIALAEAMILHQILPKDRPTTYGFYWYNSSAARVTFRTDEVVPTLSGYTVKSTIDSNREPVIAKYNANGELLHKRISKSRTMEKSTIAEIQAMLR